VRARLAVTLAAVPLMLSACGGGASSTGSEHLMPDGSMMDGSSMAGMDRSATPSHDAGMAHDAGAAGSRRPSATASMICGSEIRDAVRRVFQLEKAPMGLHSWSHRTYRCSYPLAHGDLRMSVADLDSAGPGRAFFDRLRGRLVNPSPIAGVAGFGFPAFETPQGDVVFLKDHKTLWVDATRVASSDLPRGTDRQDAAYGVAAAVIACWTE
jgi:hypothetical protein